MRIKPRWWIGVVVFLAYSAWVTAVWIWRGIDYRDIASESTRSDHPHGAGLDRWRLHAGPLSSSW